MRGQNSQKSEDIIQAENDRIKQLNEFNAIKSNHFFEILKSKCEFDKNEILSLFKDHITPEEVNQHWRKLNKNKSSFLFQDPRIQKDYNNARKSLNLPTIDF